MIIICCVCKKVIKRDEKSDKGVISHGYCKSCLRKFREDNKLKPKPLKEVISNDS